MKESIPVTVYGQSFLLRSDSSAEEVRQVAEFVNRAIDEIVATNRVADSLNVALLAFLNVAQAYLKLQAVQRGGEEKVAARLDRLSQRIEDEVDRLRDQQKI